jgi:uncharacterized membrane protein YcaP (DUF421 family)
VGLGILLPHVKSWIPSIETGLDELPTIIVEQGRPKKELERMDQIKYAVLETSGGISIIARSMTVL